VKAVTVQVDYFLQVKCNTCRPIRKSYASQHQLVRGTTGNWTFSAPPLPSAICSISCLKQQQMPRALQYTGWRNTRTVSVQTACVADVHWYTLKCFSLLFAFNQLDRSWLASWPCAYTQQSVSMAHRHDPSQRDKQTNGQDKNFYNIDSRNSTVVFNTFEAFNYNLSLCLPMTALVWVIVSNNTTWSLTSFLHGR